MGAKGSASPSSPVEYRRLRVFHVKHLFVHDAKEKEPLGSFSWFVLVRLFSGGLRVVAVHGRIDLHAGAHRGGHRDGLHVLCLLYTSRCVEETGAHMAAAESWYDQADMAILTQEYSSPEVVRPVVSQSHRRTWPTEGAQRLAYGRDHAKISNAPRSGHRSSSRAPDGPPPKRLYLIHI